MLIETSAKVYNHLLPISSNPFISEKFIEFNKHKSDKIIHLVENNEKTAFGIVVGMINGVMHSPFSAPFGGIHFKRSNQYISEIDKFIEGLKEYLRENGIRRIEITLPPDIYQHTMNSKLCNSLIRNGFTMNIPDLTNWINLTLFNLRFNNSDSRTYYNQAVKNNLAFKAINTLKQKEDIYNLIKQNRLRFKRPIYLDFQELLKMELIWPVDYFAVYDPKDSLVSAAILYQAHQLIVYAVYWGDSEHGRSFRAMDFMLFHLWSHYKKEGYKYIDLGISSKLGIPNTGLLRFKETHNCSTSLRHSFSWSPSLK